jgi:hypothetical protein
MNDGGDHEGRIDHLAETELLGKVLGPAEQRACRHIAVEQHFHALVVLISIGGIYVGVIVLEMGLIDPPVGINVFVVKAWCQMCR